MCVGGGGGACVFRSVLVFRGWGWRETGRERGMRDGVYVGVGLGVRVCACVDAGEYCCNALCIAL